MEDFDYVVVRPKPPKVCFGSSNERECLPLKGPMKTSFMKRFIPEPTPSPGPGTYYRETILGQEFPSKRGFTAFASKSPRLPPAKISKVPPVGTYEIVETKEKHQVEPPFGSIAKQLTGLKPASNIPGPGSYTLFQRRRKIYVCMGLGTRKFNIPPAQAICAPTNTSKCWRCNKTQIPGDYWRNFATGLDLCLLCMKEEVKIGKGCGIDVMTRLRKLRETSAYSLVRYCGFIHNHHGTKSAIQHMPLKAYRFKLRKEFQMSLYNFSTENM